MSNATDFYEDRLVAYHRGTQPAAPPANWYISLHTATTTDAGGGTEVSGGAYARVAVAASTAQWTASSAGNGTTSNVNAITFPAATANWGTVVDFAIWDASSAGNMWFHGPLTTSRTINSGDTFSFGANALTIVWA